MEQVLALEVEQVLALELVPVKAQVLEQVLEVEQVLVIHLVEEEMVVVLEQERMPQEKAALLPVKLL